MTGGEAYRCLRQARERDALRAAAFEACSSL